MDKNNPNYEFNRRLNDLKVDATIVRLLWLAAQAHTQECRDFFEDLTNCSDPTKKLVALFPRLAEGNTIDKSELDNVLSEPAYLGEIVTEDGYQGFMAEIHVPECDGFRWDKKGKPVSWSVHHGVSRVEYCYGESLGDLVTTIEQRVQEVFEEMCEDAHKQQPA